MTNYISDKALTSVEINGEQFFKIENSDKLRPFFMTIVSDSNHWLFVSSNGGLSAGRKNSNYALFPYYTDDKITESVETTGSKSIFWVNDKFLWEPFSIRQEGIYNISRHLYKNFYGDKIIFEETNHDLDLTFSYQWSTSDAYGFVKTSKLQNNSEEKKQIKILDGIQNILPYGVPTDTQNAVSNLVDAYKRNQLEVDYGLGIYALSAIIVDKAEPSEALKANIAWSCGFETPKCLVSSLQLNAFRTSGDITTEDDVKAEKGAYFINAEVSLESNSEKKWMIISDVNKDHSAVVQLMHDISNETNLIGKIEDDVELGTQNLIKLCASADGLQHTSDNQQDTRHFSNTLFNIMRGGVFDNNYIIEKWDFVGYLEKANKTVSHRQSNTLENLPDTFSLFDLRDISHNSNDNDFRRLCLEYMPLKFSRRHGDPSRPWNKFSINTRNEIDGSKVLDYEGNWRDIFQNWEALAYSYPEFVENMIHKFLNATTFDGYNPYRVTKDGFDWETIEPDDPWSYIGYWGDHQIIYLLKFLEFFENHKPGHLACFFSMDLFVYANVPYKIKTYQDILKNPKDTIDFDQELDESIRKNRDQLGADGALLQDKNSSIYQVNFIEKILATVLAKLSNFIPDAGIWLNTQRPEWNDANNALVGNGVSMVTLDYLHRFLTFLNGVVVDAKDEEFKISSELKVFFDAINSTFYNNKELLSNVITDTDRKLITDALGQAGSDYRCKVYANGFTGEKVVIHKSELKDFIEVTLNFIKKTIETNVRNDGMHHAYNLITITNDNISISHLDEMLEGQVAALSSGFLTSKEVLSALDSMKSSKLFREDQYSYLLYPNKDLPRFMEKNNIPKSAVKSSKLLSKLVADNNKQIIKKDLVGNFHFNGVFNNANVLDKALDRLPDTYTYLVEKEKRQILDTYEDVFNHKAFTGRSGTFYGYEGLGSIYWHMVSKLQLAVQECCLEAIENDESPEIIGRLLEHYYEINEGIGVHKSPELYGAFPTDAYSHTPAGKGAQQPGMTGQVKEDILSRIGELGVFVANSQLYFYPCMLRKEEFLTDPKTFKYVNTVGESKSIELSDHSLAFTYCQVPIVYKIADKDSVKVYLVNEDHKTVKGLKLDAKTSEGIFRREHHIERIEVNINAEILK